MICMKVVIQEALSQTDHREDLDGSRTSHQLTCISHFHHVLQLRGWQLGTGNQDLDTKVDGILHHRHSGILHENSEGG
jgi:hypothetical protein